MYKFFKLLYFLLPGKKHVYSLVRLFYLPSIWMSGYLKFDGVFTLALLGDKKVKIYNDHSTVPTLLFWLGLDGYEKCSLEVWSKLSVKSKMVMDIGANFGLFGLVSKALSPQSDIILFEPLERNVKRVKKNFETNNFEVKVETAAVGDRVGDVTFFDMKSNENTIGSIDENFVKSHKHHKEIVPIKVPMMTIDSLMYDEVDLMKIDVEGADFEAVKGAFNTISKCKPNILIEITNQQSAINVIDLLTKLDFKYFIYELSDEDGVISCSSIIRKEGARNYLLSTLDSRELLSIFDIMSN